MEHKIQADTILIRRAAPADTPELVAMRRAFKVEYDVAPVDPEFDVVCNCFLADAMDSERWQIWVAEYEGAVISHAYVAIIQKVPSPHLVRGWIGYMTNVYTKPDFRGQGIGARLVSRAQESARDSGVELIVLWPSETSRNFYARLGFEYPGEPLVWSSGVED